MKSSIRSIITVPLLALMIYTSIEAQDPSWYQQGIFFPEKRIELKIINTLDIARKDVPVVIARAEMPVSDLHELEVTLVDQLQKR